MANGNGDQKIDDVLSYPILTEEVHFPATSRSTNGGASGTPGSSGYGQMVEGALRNILGWRVRENDPKGFVSALTQAFQVTEVQGHTEWKWTPRTYAIEADLGAVTGAQAALYTRAKTALNQALPLLDGLQTLLAASDEQEIEAMSAIVRSSVMELVAELGQEGGPINSRVDDYFALLLGDGAGDLVDSEQVGGQLGLLRDSFGLKRENVNTVEEERNLTNFLILVDSVNSLKITWDSQKVFFDRLGTDVFLGTQLVQLSRTLAVVAESVQETYFVMDSVFLGPAERQVTPLTLSGGPIFVGELLGWVERFALEEGPRLLREGGKDGVIHSFQPTVDKLQKLVTEATTAATVTAALRTTRVTRALTELSAHLKTVFDLANQIKRAPKPVISIVRPDQAHFGVSVTLEVIGANFIRGAKVRLEKADNRNAQINSKEIFVDGAQVLAEFDLSNAPAVPDSDWVVVVTNRSPDGQSAEWKPFKILSNGEPPTSAPLAPENLHVIAVLSHSAKLGWNESASVEEYEVIQQDSTGVRTRTTTTETTMILTGLTPGTTHLFRVIAVDSAGHTSQPSNQISVTTDSLASVKIEPATLPIGTTTLSEISGQINEVAFLADKKAFLHKDGNDLFEVKIVNVQERSFQLEFDLDSLKNTGNAVIHFKSEGDILEEVPIELIASPGNSTAGRRR
jgi:hypothetical protein